MKIYKMTGEIATVTAPMDIKSGELFQAGALVGFAQADAAEGELVAIVTEGVFEITVASAVDLDLGDVVYLADGEATADSEAAGAMRLGVVYGPGVSNGTSVTANVKINA